MFAHVTFELGALGRGRRGILQGDRSLRARASSRGRSARSVQRREFFGRGVRREGANRDQEDRDDRAPTVRESALHRTRMQHPFAPEHGTHLLPVRRGSLQGGSTAPGGRREILSPPSSVSAPSSLRGPHGRRHARCSRSGVHGRSLDQDRALPLLHGVRVAARVDPVVAQRPVQQSRRDEIDRSSPRSRFRHPGSIRCESTRRYESTRAASLERCSERARPPANRRRPSPNRSTR